MKNILLPLTSYANHENLLAYAIQLAKRSSAELSFLYTGSIRSTKTVENKQISEAQLVKKIRSAKLKDTALGMFSQLQKEGVGYTCVYAVGSNYSGILKESKRKAYDLILLPAYGSGTLLGYVHNAWLHKIIENINTPAFIVPREGNVNDIRHITYAVDLAEYDPDIIKKIKNLASLLDAKLSLVHVNPNEEGEKKNSYLFSLEKTISDTLDYPKVQYNFFDHQDILSGLHKTVKLNDSQLIAMTNRKQFSWRELLWGKSFTQKMAKKSTVPLLAFSKYSRA